MNWKYIKSRKRLNVFGKDCDRDILTVKKLTEEGKIPKDIDSIVYRESINSKFSAIFRGAYLASLLTPEPEENTPRVMRPKIKNILRTINESNTFESIYAGVIFYSTTTKRFMLVTPRGKHNSSMLLGDHPIEEAETPVDIVCRVAGEDTGFEIDPKWLIDLAQTEVAGVIYHSYLVLVEREFKPNLSARLLNTVWSTPDHFKELRLHPSVKEVFANDPNLQKLSKAEDEIDFEVIIEEILQDQRDKQ